MTLSYTYDGGALAHNIAPTGIALPTRADMGEASFGGIPIEDPGASLTMLGHRPFVVEDDECAQPRLWTGYVTERGIGRSLDRGMFVGPNARLHDMTIVDCNAVFDFRMIKGTDGNRPEETWDERLAWILASNYLDGTSGTLITGSLRSAGGWLMSSSVTMDKADYRSTYPSGVMSDLAARFDGFVNWFAFWNPAASRVELFFDVVDAGIADCTLSISNVIADVDSIVTFAPDSVASLAREPDQTYSEVTVTYANGSVFRTLPATATKYIRRGTTISRPYIGKASTAEIAGDRFLASHSTETDRITCSIQVPAASVGLIQAGMRIACRFSHMPGYEASTWLRIVGCSPKPTNDVADFYTIELELVAPKVPEPAGLDAWITTHHSGFYQCDNAGDDYYGDGAALVGWSADGDDAPPGWVDMPLVGPVEYVAWPIASHCLWRGLALTADATVDIDLSGNFGGVASGAGSSIKVDIRKNGTIIATETKADPAPGLHFWGGQFRMSLLDYAALDEDEFTVTVTFYDWADFQYFAHIPSMVYDQTHFRVTGTGAWAGTVPGDPLPTPGRTTIADVDPTVDDDADAGFHVGDHWLNSVTGEEFVLVDDTVGAAVWLSTTSPGPAGIEYVIDGGGLELTTGLKGFLEVPFGCTITAARLLADQTGSIVVDVWSKTFAAYPPTAFDSICNVTPPTIAAGIKSQDVTLSGWTTALAAGTILGFYVNSVTDVTRVTLSLTVAR